jgi:hypothetical protein
MKLTELPIFIFIKEAMWLILRFNSYQFASLTASCCLNNYRLRCKNYYNVDLHPRTKIVADPFIELLNLLSPHYHSFVF